jgi:ADP-ribosylglycohydrolase
MQHIRDKIQTYAIAEIDDRQSDTLLSSPQHPYWTESQAGAAYSEVAPTSLMMEGVDVSSRILQAVAGIPENTPRWRAFWAIIGALVADAAAQPTHWNYKVTYYQAELKARGRWDEPEFMRESMNAFYRVPLGCHTNYGDQAIEQLRSLVDKGGFDPVDTENRFFSRFGESYEPLTTDHRKKLPIKGPWRHGSIAEFVKNVDAGRHWPRCGSKDAQADCFCKIVPVVALYAGRPEMRERVSEAVRVTQNNDFAVAGALAFAQVLEAIIMEGAGGRNAVQKMVGHVQDATLSQALESALQESHRPFPEAVLALSGGSYNMAKIA